MGFLHKLWDETLAGPTPETGLGRLRKYNSFSAVRSPNHPMISRYHHDDHNHHTPNNIPVTRSITILRTRNFPSQPGSGPPSPAGSSGPPSPNSPGSVKDQDVKRFTRKKQRFDAMEHAEITNTTVYDWIMISTLDS